MFATEEYIWAWVFYIVGGLAVLASWWYFTASWKPFEIKWLSRIIPTVLVCVPWTIKADSSYLAPAWFTSAADFLTLGIDAFWRAGLILVVVLVVSILLAAVYFLWRRIRD